jgi:hypothetical protein
MIDYLTIGSGLAGITFQIALQKWQDLCDG